MLARSGRRRFRSGSTRETKLELRESHRLFAPVATHAAHGKLTLTSGAGIDTITSNNLTVGGAITAKLGNGNNTASFFDLTAGGALALTTGTGNETLTTDNLDVTGSVSAVLGDGTNSATFVGALGSLKLTSGSGTDTFSLTNLAVRGATSLSTGAGDDTVRTGDSRFSGSFSLLAGTGADTFSVEQGLGLALNNGVSTFFQGAFSLDAGSGDDNVTPGLDTTDSAVLLGAVKLNGGIGANTLSDRLALSLAAIISQKFTLV